MALKLLSSSYRSNYRDWLRHCGFRFNNYRPRMAPTDVKTKKDVRKEPENLVGPRTIEKLKNCRSIRSDAPCDRPAAGGRLFFVPGHLSPGLRARCPAVAQRHISVPH